MKESHYNKGGIEVIDFIQDQLTPEEFNGFCKGNILKYVPRSNHKGDPIADAQKVRDYADYWINANLRAKPTFKVSVEEVQEAALEKVGLKLAEKDQEIDELQHENVELKEELSGVKGDLKRANADRINSVNMATALRESVDRLQKENKELEAEIARLKDDKAELKTVIERLKVEIDTRSNEARDHGRLKGSKDSLIKKLDADLKKAEKDRLNSVKMAEALRESVDRLQKENAELDQKEVVIESLESQVGALLTEVKQREAENEELKKSIASYKRENTNLYATVSEKNARVRELEAESFQAQHEPPISNVDPSGRIAPADDAPDNDARFLSTDDDDGLPRIRY